MKMDSVDGVDLILTQLGMGPWNYYFILAALLVPAMLPVFLVGCEFINPQPVFTCNLPNNNTVSYNGSQCLMVEEWDGEDVIMPCTSWTYDTSAFTSTVSMEWDLVCDRQSMSTLFQTIYTLGCFVGAILTAIFAHRYGRRCSVRIGSVGTVVSVVIMTTTPWLSLLFTSRFLLGIFNTVMVYPVFILCLEVCVPRLRPMLGIMLALPCAIMMMFLGIVAYFIRDWRTLQVVGSIPCFLVLVVVLFVDESPRWLVVQGRVDEAVKVLQRGAALNKVTLPDSVTIAATITATIPHMYKSQEASQATFSEENKKIQEVSTVEVTLEDGVWPEGHRRRSSIADTGVREVKEPWWSAPMAMMANSVTRKLMAVLVTLWFLQSVVYLGLPLSADYFSSPFLYMVLLGLMEIPAYTLTAPVTRHLGRRAVVAFSLLTCGFLLLTQMVFNLAGFFNEWAEVTLVMISYLFICTAYQVNFLYAPELLPTTLRPWGTAVCTLAANIGYSVSPFITDYLAEEQPVVCLIFAICAMVAGSLVFLLPETNGKPLMETMADLQTKGADHLTLTKPREEATITPPPIPN